MANNWNSFEAVSADNPPFPASTGGGSSGLTVISPIGAEPLVPANMPGEPAAKVYVIEGKRVELERPAESEPKQAEDGR